MNARPRVVASSAKNSEKSPYIKMLGLLVCTWLIPASWVALSPPFFPPAHFADTTRAHLTHIKHVMHAFIKHHKSAPADLNFLRAFAHARQLPFTPYDAYAQRFSYTRLGKRHYLLRSFGPDGAQNRPGTSIDRGIVSWGARPAQNPSYQYLKKSEPGIFPAVLLAGADSPDGSWLARIFVDQQSMTSQLLIRHHRQNGLFMAAPHDRVEEFLWLPDGKRIAYTATGSVRHRDGLYLWDLRDDSVINLLDTAAGTSRLLSPTTRQMGLWLSLAGMSKEGPTIYAHFAPRSDGSLNPEFFFSKEQLVGFDLRASKAGGAKLLSSKELALAQTPPPYARSLSLNESLELSGVKPLGSSVQKRWQSLPLQGDMEETLLAWHAFIEKEADSPLGAYSLWLLSSLYSESFSLLSHTNSRDADVLRTYGTEIARALVNMPTAPSYLRALALHTYDYLMNARRLPYRFAQLSVKDGLTTNNATPVSSSEIGKEAVKNTQAADTGSTQKANKNTQEAVERTPQP